MAGVIVNMNCPLCNGDGYMVISDAAWKNFVTWHEDPSEDKSTSPEAFPEFMKKLHSIVGGKVDFDHHWVMCPTCGGNKTVQREISFADLKELLK